MKRLLLVFLCVLVLSLSSCKRDENAKHSFSQKGIYIVNISDTDIEFKAVFNGAYQEYTFHSPDTLSGLKAKSYDGISYELDYQGITTKCYADAIKYATDFYSATKLLETVGVSNGEHIVAEAEGLTAEAYLTDGKPASVTFIYGTNTKIYKVKTEATG